MLKHVAPSDELIFTVYNVISSLYTSLKVCISLKQLDSSLVFIKTRFFVGAFRVIVAHLSSVSTIDCVRQFHRFLRGKSSLKHYINTCFPDCHSVADSYFALVSLFSHEDSIRFWQFGFFFPGKIYFIRKF